MSEKDLYISLGIVDINITTGYRLFNILDSFMARYIYCFYPVESTVQLVRSLMSWPRSPHILFINVNVGPKSGVDLIHFLKISDPKMRTVVVSFEPDNMYAIEMLKAGAYEYLNRDMTIDEIEALIRKLFEEPDYYSKIYHNLEPLLGGEINLSAFSAEEIRFLELNAKCLTLWDIGVAMSLSSSSVKLLLDSLYQKMGVNDRVDMVVYAVRKGLIKLIDNKIVDNISISNSK